MFIVQLLDTGERADSFFGDIRFKVVSIVQRGWESIVNASLTLSSVTIIP